MKKKKLFTLFTTLVLCLCTMAIGVYAAKTATVTSGGTVAFTATGVFADVTGVVSNAKNTAENKTLTTLSFNATANASQSWTGINVTFKDCDSTSAISGNKISIAITVKNKATDRSISVSFAQTTAPTGAKINLPSTGSVGKASSASTTTDGTFTITLELTDITTSKSSVSFAFTTTLTAAAA